jgi:hypothetical protein
MKPVLVKLDGEIVADSARINYDAQAKKLVIKTCEYTKGNYSIHYRN